MFDIETKQVLLTVGVTGWTGPGSNQLSLPHGVAIHEGQLFVADFGNHRVQVFDMGTGKYTKTLIGLPSGGAGAAGSDYTAGRISRPQGIAIDPAAMLCYVCEGGNQV